MRLYREHASEFELLAENEPLSEVRLRYRIIAGHYRELAKSIGVSEFPLCFRLGDLPKLIYENRLARKSSRKTRD
jgi:hypothetical protein